MRQCDRLRPMSLTGDEHLAAGTYGSDPGVGRPERR